MGEAMQALDVRGEWSVVHRRVPDVAMGGDKEMLEPILEDEAEVVQVPSAVVVNGIGES